MAVPTLTPKRTTSAVVLPSTGSTADVSDGAAKVTIYPFGMYADPASPLYDRNFIAGAADQVSYTYKKLGGDVVDVELTTGNIYAAYEEAVLEYSYLINVHQAKNALPNMLGNSTGSFDNDGMLRTDSDSSLTDQEISLKYPKFKLGYSKKIGEGISTETGMGGTQTIYSASITLNDGQQDYDLQELIMSASIDNTHNDKPYFKKINNKKITVKRVYYRSPHAMWRFYGYYGGMNTVGNLSTYGMFADDSTFEVIPPWHNKLQAMAYEDAIYTRNSHYSYEIKNNKLRVHPEPGSFAQESLWFEFTVESDAWEQDGGQSGTDGINNMNTLPFANIPYDSINSMGKQWIRRFALALSKEMLAQVRGKFTSIPIPGNDLTMNAAELSSQAQNEQQMLREELKAVLDELTYKQMTTDQATMMGQANEATKVIPMGIFHG